MCVPLSSGKESVTSNPRRLLTRMPYKQVSERSQLDDLLDEVMLGYVGWATDQAEPHVLPVVIGRWGDDVVWHGSTGSGWLRSVAGRRVAVSVSSIEALVVGRSRLEHSFWYRSAVMYGTPRRLTGGEAASALDRLTDHILPGRLAETRESRQKELKATAVFAMRLTDWVLKESRDWPDDDDADRASGVWAGVVPLARSFGKPVAAPDLDPSVAVPESCRRLSQTAH